MTTAPIHAITIIGNDVWIAGQLQSLEGIRNRVLSIGTPKAGTVVRHAAPAGRPEPIYDQNWRIHIWAHDTLEQGAKELADMMGAKYCDDLADWTDFVVANL